MTRHLAGNLHSVQQISLAPPTDPAQRRILRVLAMVSELHKAGYQRLRIAPGLSPSGAYWRCHVAATSNMRPNGWEPIDWEGRNVAIYTSGAEDRYFDWADAPGKTARELAQMFIERFSELAKMGICRDWVYVGWYQTMLGAAENGRIPIFFADWDLERDPDAMPPAI